MLSLPFGEERPLFAYNNLSAIYSMDLGAVTSSETEKTQEDNKNQQNIK
jgi:hypothetical protein